MGCRLFQQGNSWMTERARSLGFTLICKAGVFPVFRFWRGPHIIPSMPNSQILSTDDLASTERALAWQHWMSGLFGGLDSDLYGDSVFDGHIATSHAGDVVMTRLEANRHRVMRSPRLARTSDTQLPEDHRALARQRRAGAAGPANLGAPRRLGDL